jgi:dihydroorotate dehydrogenase
LKKNYDDIQVIGGGGIQTKQDMEVYKKFGADHFAMSTLFFCPYRAYKLWNHL